MKKVFVAALVLLTALLSASALAQAQDVTADCKFWVSEGDVSAITDGSVKTGWEPDSENAEIRIGLPENAGYVYLDWLNDPTGYVFTQYDVNQSPISETDLQQSFVGISQMFTLDDGTRFVSLKLIQSGQSVQKIRVYSRGELPLSAKNFLPAHEKCDLMVVSAHQDDEWIFFGGIIPYYEYVMEKKVQVVYMANCGRLRKAEALNGLWAGGVRNHPDFINLKDENISSLSEALEHWGGKEGLTEILVERIRRFKPEVILTHDIDGEYGHNQHKLTSRAMETAIIAAADPTQFPESYAQYGAWQVKKLYLHLAANAIDFDWNVSYEQLRGYTPLEVARIAYSKHESQQEFYQVNDGGKYDNSLFGLTYSTVGEDVAKDDLFEHIVSASPAETAQPVPQPTPEPEIVATPEPQMQNPPLPEDEPISNPEIPSAAKSEKSGGSHWLIAVGAGAAVAVSALAVYTLQSRKHRRKRRRRYR